MELDPNNAIVKLCAKGMDIEGSQPEAASRLFLQAWEEAGNEVEKFIAAHYVARHQKTAVEKLKWDVRALALALSIPGDAAKTALPSLYLNIAKCHEELNDRDLARRNYESGLSFIDFLPDDGYGNMIRGGLRNGLERVSTGAEGLR
ncbi:MAG TPA: hypothetical protein VL098_06950 [Flavipsychrobacter sp.]|nr:hypothetical protein [Flavipsychrobacter sp.]